MVAGGRVSLRAAGRRAGADRGGSCALPRWAMPVLLRRAVAKRAAGGSGGPAPVVRPAIGRYSDQKLLELLAAAKVRR